MKTLKNLRLEFKGELHEIHLVNFSVDAAELKDRLPEPIRPRLQDGRALISLVDVQLRNMRARRMLLPFRFHYQHIGFRVLVEDAQWNPEHEHKGVFFLASFTDKRAIARVERLFSNYRLELARLTNAPAGMRLEYGDRFLEYYMAGPVMEPTERLEALQAKIGAVDRAWAVEDHELKKTQIVREKWPLEPMNCFRFETNFFETARLEGIFRVPETIHYTWLSPETVLHLPASAPIDHSALTYA